MEALLDDASEYDSEMESFRTLCQQVTGYYLIERYPLAGVARPSESEVAAARETAQELIEKIRQSVSG